MVLWDKPHNSALEILLTTGLGGALAYLAIFVLTLRAFVRARQNKLVSWGEMVVLVCGSVAYQIQGLFGFDSPAATVTLSVYTGFAAGLWIQPRRNLGGHAVIGRSLGLPSRAAVVTLMLLSCWGIYITDVVTASTILNIQDGAAMTGINDRIAKDCLDKADESLFVYDRNALSRQYTVLAVRVAARRQSVPQFVHSVFDAATSATHRAIDRAANEEELWLELIHLCFLRAKYDQVPVGTSIEQAIRKAIELAPDRIEPWEYLARYNLDKDVADAERIVDHILKSDPRSAQSFWIRALAYRHDGRQELAAESAMEAINLGYNPELFGDLAWLIDYYAKRHMYSDVIGLYNMWIGIDPDDSQSYEGLARTFAEEGDSVKAKAAWNQWKVCDLVEKHAYRQLARFYERVLPSNATDPGLYVSLARVYLELGEKEKAKLAAKRAAELNSDLGFRMRLFVSVLQ
jgi:tetratricopeptide (TPR) repeat protein